MVLHYFDYIVYSVDMNQVLMNFTFLPCVIQTNSETSFYLVEIPSSYCFCNIPAFTLRHFVTKWLNVLSILLALLIFASSFYSGIFFQAVKPNEVFPAPFSRSALKKLVWIILTFLNNENLANRDLIIINLLFL